MADSSSTNSGPGEAPKLIIDSDWKASAQKEKERLAIKEKEAQAKAQATAPAGAAPGAAGGQARGEQELPEADFQGVVGILVTQALMYMGGFPDPETGRALVSLEHAKFHIDALGVLEAKTKGNLTKEEASDISLALSELRMRFVEIAKAIAQASKEGKLGRGGAGGPGAISMGGAPGLGGMGGGMGGGGMTFTGGPGGMTKM